MPLAWCSPWPHPSHETTLRGASANGAGTCDGSAERLAAGAYRRLGQGGERAPQLGERLEPGRGITQAPLLDEAGVRRAHGLLCPLEAVRDVGDHPPRLFLLGRHQPEHPVLAGDVAEPHPQQRLVLEHRRLDRLVLDPPRQGVAPSSVMR